MDKSEVTHLYKYRPFNEFTLDIIASNRIYFPKPAIFNDPYDCKIELDKKVSLEEYLKIIEHDAALNFISKEQVQLKTNEVKAAGKVPQDFLNNLSFGVDQYHQGNRHMGVLSLSEDPKNILMWAHYANDHKGICIEFARNESNSLGKSDVTRPVKYLVGYPKVKAIDFIIGEPGSATKKMLWSKSKDWEYEKEWRMLCTQGDSSFPVPGEITSIIFGIRTPTRNIEIVRRLTKGSGIKLRRAEMLKNNYGVKINKLI